MGCGLGVLCVLEHKIKHSGLFLIKVWIYCLKPFECIISIRNLKIFNWRVCLDGDKG